jgi:hypothetical protein
MVVAHMAAARRTLLTFTALSLVSVLALSPAVS